MAWAPDYVTTTELASFIRIPDTADDAVLARSISAASRAVDRTCNRQFGQTAAVEERYYTPVWDRKRWRWIAEIDDVMTSTGLLVDFDESKDETFSLSIASSDYVLRPRNAAAKSRPWTELLFSGDVTLSCYEDGLRVTARYGWTAVPEAVKEATLLQASRLVMRRDAPFGVAGSSDGQGELRLLNKVDPDVEVVLGDYVRWWGAV